jgi:hypothetical protein
LRLRSALSVDAPQCHDDAWAHVDLLANRSVDPLTALAQLRAQTAVGSLRRALERTEQRPSSNHRRRSLGGGSPRTPSDAADRTQDDKLQQRAALMLAPRVLSERQIAKAAAAAAKSATLKAGNSAGVGPLRSSKEKSEHHVAKGHFTAPKGDAQGSHSSSGHSSGNSSNGHGHGHMPRETHRRS